MAPDIAELPGFNGHRGAGRSAGANLTPARRPPIIIGHAARFPSGLRNLATKEPTNLVVSDVLRTNELQVWFISEHLVNMPLVEAEDTSLAS